jgi:NDP-sugar pyrophosphorylase family protein
MALSELSRTNIIALLSAANATDDLSVGFAMTLAGGEPLLAHQISALRNHGITRFLIEVDSVSGALLTLADKFKNSGCSIDFVRSASDLQPFLRLNAIGPVRGALSINRFAR